MRTTTIPRNRHERGYILIAALIMLVVLTLLGVGMYHSFTEQENMAANSKEKARAFQMAQSTLQYGEYLLQQNVQGLAQGNSCTAVLTTPTVCTNAVAIASPTGSAAMTLTNGMVYNTIGGTNAPSLSKTGGAGTYYADPQVYIQYLGMSPNGQGQIYEVTALGYGGTSNAVAVVQSTYQITTGVKNLGGL